MTAPRYIVPGSTYLITRRTSERRFFLVPSLVVNRVALYCLARATRKHSVDIHCANVLSTHLHIIVTDNRGNLPDFLHDLHHAIGRCLNQHYERRENFWNNDHTSVVRLETPQAVLEKIAYCQLNVVSAGLVRHRNDWPGVNLGPRDWLRKAKQVKRPRLHFNKDKEQLAEVPLQIVPPQMLLDGREAEEIAREVNRYVDEQEQSVRREIISQGRNFMGVKKVLKTAPFDSPKTRPAGGKLKPVSATGNSETMKRAIARYKAFVQDYLENRLLWLRGLPHRMPAGTYWLRHHSTATCAPFTALDTG